MKTSIVAGDFHIPYHDKMAVRRFLADVKAISPHRIILNGDVLDCASFSVFRKEPSTSLFKEELAETRTFLKTLCKATQGRITYLSGNHEQRLAKRILELIPGLYGSVCLEEMLGLDGLGIEYVTTLKPDNYMEADGVLVGHFSLARKKAGYTAHALVEKYGQSVVQGHTHRLGLNYRRVGDRQLFGVESGCLCSLDPPYASMPDWTHGYVVLDGGRPNLVRL